MTLQNFFNNTEIDTIIHALEAQRTKWNAVAKKPIQGYGSSKEYEKKEAALVKVTEIENLLTKITDYTI